MILLIVALSLIIILLILLFHPTCKSYFGNTTPIFKSPPSFTKLSVPLSQTKLSTLSNTTIANKKGTLIDRYAEKLNQVIANNTTTVDKVNIIQIPTFFNSGEKWPGCLPRPLYQGSCGSCWGFAGVTCLSSRFYIETCGNSSCGAYPQINSGSIDDVYANLNEIYIIFKSHLNYNECQKDQKYIVLG
jgi:hypothetical protein